MKSAIPPARVTASAVNFPATPTSRFRGRARLALLALLAVAWVCPALAETQFIPAGAVWKYLDNGVDQGTAWREIAFNDNAWSSGPAALGYGDPVTTTISFGPDANNKYTTYYFRKKFTVADPSIFGSLLLSVRRDDGVVIYINGTEVARSNMPEGPVVYSTLAPVAVGGTDETTFFPFLLPASALVAGDNVVAVELHQANISSSDAEFDLSLTANVGPQVSIASPVDGAVVAGPVNLRVAVDAVDPDGVVTRVELYEGAFRHGTDTNAPFSIVASNLVDGFYAFQAVAYDNNGASSTSTVVRVDIVDPAPPTLARITATTNQVFVTFNKRVAPAGALDINSYSISNSASVLAAEYGAKSNVVILTVSTLQTERVYHLTVTGVTDFQGQPMGTPNSLPFEVVTYIATDIGQAAIPSVVTKVPGGYDFSAAGTGIGSAADQLSLNYQQRTGDFDVRVRVSALSLVDVWSRAGLMARQSLLNSSPFVAAWATPNITGCFLESRAAAGTAPVFAGTAPVNYPYTWVRLKRAGNVYSAFASADGTRWTPLGSVTVALGDTVYLGMGATSQNANEAIRGGFRDMSEVTTAVNGPSFTDREPPGPSGRRTGLVFSEIMYHPAPREDGRNLEFIEIFNSNPYFERLSGYRLSGEVDFPFPDGLRIPGGGTIVIAKVPADVEAVYGLTGVLGPYTNSLSDGGGRLRLRGNANEVLLEVNYNDGGGWPVAADGTGHSMVLARPSRGEDTAAAWAASDVVGGSPGRWEGVSPEPLRGLVINEILAHSVAPGSDYVELFNSTAASLDISGCWLSDIAGTNRYQIPPGTVVPARSWWSVSAPSLGFGLEAAGGKVFLMNPSGTRVVDAVRYGSQSRNVSVGRIPDGGPNWHDQSARTPGGASSGRLRRDIVINEIFYSPPTGDGRDEFLELHNRGATVVDVSGWRFTDGIDFTIPAGTTMAPGAYLVVARDAARVVANHPGLSAASVVGDFGGTLANSGERLALAMPEQSVSLDGLGQPVTNGFFVTVAELSYDDGGRWPIWSGGGGSSLELVDPEADPALPSSWADSDESGKGTWAPFEWTAPLSESLGSPVNDNLQLFLLGIGECLVDDVELRSNNGANLVANPGFENGLTGWTRQGSHDHSVVATGGFSGTSSLWLRAASRGDNGGNRIRSTALSATGPVTFRAKVKWVRGWPELMLRLHGGTAELTCRMPVPTNLGTPGAANSRRVANAGPGLWDASHSPALPASGEAVVLTVRAADPQGVASVVARWRVDGGNTFASLPMKDDGTGGDAVAGDGIFSVNLAGQAGTATVAYYVEATDSLGAVRTYPTQLTPDAGYDRLFPLDSTRRDLLIRWGDTQMPGNLTTYHMWTSAATESRWTTRDRLNNSVFDITFVFNNHRVLYNSGALYAGSPWHSGQMTTGPAGSQRVDYVLQAPEDDMVLGATDFVLNNPGNPGGDSTTDTSAQAEETSYLIFRQVGVQYNYRRYIHLFVNGSQRSRTSNRTGNFIFSDSQQPNSDLVREYFPDDTDGELFKIEDWFEFADDGIGFSNNDADLERRSITVNGQPMLTTTPYRFMWRRRAVAPGDSASNYTNFFRLVDTVSPAASPTSSQIVNPAALSELADMEQWMHIIAVQHTIGNWDSYGYNRGKNSYAYKGDRNRWNLWTWDIDFTMGVGGDGPQTGLFGTSDPRIAAMWNTMPIRRAYWRAYRNILNGPLSNAYLDPVLDARQAALQANNVNVDPGTVTTIKNFIRDRRIFIESQLATVQVPFSISGTNRFTTNNNLVTITGRAPVEVGWILLNGLRYPFTWTTENTWVMRIPVVDATNVLTFQATDIDGNVIPGMTSTVTVVYTGTPQDPVGNVVFHELMYAPPQPGTGFVEFFNRSTNFTFDLSGWRVNGLDYTFPPGSFLAPLGYLVLVEDPASFALFYGASVPIFGRYDGRLDPDGETLSLIKPGATPLQDQFIDRFHYEGSLPWPLAAAENGASLQLVDPAQDNRRVANWKDSPEWRFVSKTGEMRATARLLLYLNAPGETYVDDISLVIGTTPAVGTNFIRFGDVETADAFRLNHTNRYFYIATNYRAGSGFVTSQKHSGLGSMFMRSTNYGGAGSNAVIYQNFSPAPTNRQISTLSYWFRLGGANTLNVLVQGAPQLNTTAATLPVLATPGTNNSGVAATLEPFQSVWINEVAPGAAGGFVDNAGQEEPWLELFNAGTSPVSLDGLYLADQYTNLTQWAIPSGITLAPGEFKLIVADGQAGQGTPAEPHAPFRLSTLGGKLALSRISAGEVQVLDYVNYPVVAAANSFGSFPNGDPYGRAEMSYPTPGATNNGAYPLVTLFINEWMAINNTILPDPADGQFEDWFEIYNPGDADVPIGGFYLTDDLLDPRQFRVPAGYVVPAHGHLIVWADGEPEQNTNASPQLHVSFRLAATGDSIALHAPDGRLVDAVTFGAQVADVSQGRQPDGAALIGDLPAPTPGTGNPPPASNIILTIARDGASVKLSWSTRAGGKYQLEARDVLGDGAWAPQGGVLTAAGESLEVTDLIGAGPRFYRVRLVP